MLNANQETYVEKISFILLNQLIAQCNASYEGLAHLKSQLRNFIQKQQKIQLLLPAFPCKTNNLDKVLGHTPDIGEYLVLRKFVQCIRDIQSVYEPGVIFYIFSDYHTFSDYISVNLEHHYDYSDNLRKMVANMNCSDSLKIMNLEHFDEFKNLKDTQYFDSLREIFGEPDYAKNFSKLKLKNNKMNQTYLGLKKFMNQDQKHILAPLSYKDRRQRLAQIAKGMMVQGKALDNFLQQKFADCIRLSIHEHPMVGKKYSLFLFNERQFKTPWHSTLLFDASRGKFIVDSKENHLKRPGLIVPVTHDGKPWCYLQLNVINRQNVEALSQLKAELMLEKFALMLECSSPHASFSMLHPKELSHLVREFGSVRLRGFSPLNHSTELQAWYLNQRSAVTWDFEVNVEGLKSRSIDLPFHWALSCPPVSMNIDSQRYQYEDFTPHEYAVYCAESDANNVWETTDATLAVLALEGQEREQLRHTVMHYSNFTPEHVGTTQHPIIRYCSISRQEVLRWQDLQHAHGFQTHIEGVNDLAEQSSIHQHLSTLCHSPKVCVEYSLQQGDLLLINNLTTLQACQTSNKDEYWRIHLQPESINSPWQPHNRLVSPVSEAV
ncbi:L-tyrosine/L-tryptophan isonitrile synthase family protein [Vibrio mimicus]|uniref:L-tyrosine/L-tryptophan isonitrile synthase family protein n=1 Tax=Vibrio mimicus TaxID=674 RepID=UPI002FF1BBF3